MRKIEGKSVCEIDKLALKRKIRKKAKEKYRWRKGRKGREEREFFFSIFLISKMLWVANYAAQSLGSADSSSAETVEGAALSLKSVDNVESGDGLSLGVFGVHNGVADNVLEEGSEDSAGLLVDVGRDSLHTTSSCESADSGLGDSEDGLTEGLATEFHALSAGLAAADAALAFATAAADLSSWCHL